MDRDCLSADVPPIVQAWLQLFQKLSSDHGWGSVQTCESMAGLNSGYLARPGPRYWLLSVCSPSGEFYRSRFVFDAHDDHFLFPIESESNSG